MIRPTFLPLIFVILLFTFPSALAQETQSYNDNRSSIVTSATQNLLTVVSFLIGTSSFLLALSIQNIQRLHLIPLSPNILILDTGVDGSFSSYHNLWNNIDRSFH